MRPVIPAGTSPVSRPVAAGPGSQHGSRALLAAGVAVAAVAAGLYLTALATHPAISTLKGFDLHVYLMGGTLAKEDPARLYTWQLQTGIQFTYTPFAALLFALATGVPFRLLLDVAAAVSVAAVAATTWIAFRELGWRGTARIGASLLVAGLSLWLEPVQRALYLGQIECALMVLVVWDLCQPERRRWQGAATGIAAGLKLVPLLFIVYLVVIGRFRQAAVATAAFAATVIAGFAVLPHQSVQWWLHGYFLEASRTGFVGQMLNQSERGLLTRLAGSVTTGQWLWLAAAAVTAICGLAAAAVLHRAGQTFAGLMVCALTALLVSPISWDHHWVWVAPGLAVLVDAAARASGAGRRAARAGWLAAAAAVAVVFAAWPVFWRVPRGTGAGLLRGGLIWYAPTNGDYLPYREYHWHGLQLIAGNLYVIAGGLLLALALVAAVQTARAGRAGNIRWAWPAQRTRT